MRGRAERHRDLLALEVGRRLDLGAVLHDQVLGRPDIVRQRDHLVGDLLADAGGGRRRADAEAESTLPATMAVLISAPEPTSLQLILTPDSLSNQPPALATIVGCVARKNATLKVSGAWPAASRLRAGKAATSAAALSVAVPMKTLRLEPPEAVSRADILLSFVSVVLFRAAIPPAEAASAP